MKPVIVAIVGPTAVGKSQTAIDVCKALRGEVVSMDSMQIYQGMDIGTAKPDVAQRAAVPHHLLDIAAPGQAFTVAQYRDAATAVIDGILRRGRLPVLTGGTGLYLDALTRPMNLAEASCDEALRNELRALSQTPQGRRELHARLEKVDPESAARLHENDVRRVIRALEVYDATGKSMSEYRTQDAQGEGLYTPLVYGLTLPREMLYARINARVDEMMRAGLMQEVQGLLQEGMLPEKDGALQAIGYKELVGALRGESTVEEAVEAIKMHSRRYAKRQWTWFRRDERIKWFDVTQYKDTDEMVQRIISTIKDDLSKSGE